MENVKRLLSVVLEWIVLNDSENEEIDDIHIYITFVLLL